MLILPPRLCLAALLLAPTSACGDNNASLETGRAGESAANREATIEPAPPPIAAPQQPPETGVTTIPERFQGRWDASAEACAGRPGEMRLTVERDRLLFHESVAQVVAVRAEGQDALSVDLALEGEGERWRETRTLRLVGNDRLEITVGDVAATRVRCAG